MNNLHTNVNNSNITKMDTSDKIYLSLCSLIIIGMLFTATIKKSLI
jgi:hypothetical protein